MPRAFNSLSSHNKFAKRHYEAIALAMQDACPLAAHGSSNADPIRRNQWESVRNELADMFARDNGRFCRDRFMHACEPGANVQARSNGGTRRKAKLFQSAKHAISFFARSAARQAVKQKLTDEGRRMTLVPVSEIAEQAEVYLEQHPELFLAALERAKQLGFVEAKSIHVTPDPI